MQQRGDSIKRRVVQASTIVAALMLPAVALASGGGGEDGGFFSIWYIQLAGSIVNFTILVYLLIRFGGPKMTAFLENRKAIIERDMKEAARVKEEAHAAMDELRTRLDALDEERARILEEYEELGQAEHDRIIKEAQAQAARIAQEARMTAETEAQRARQKMERQVLEEALRLAEETLRKRVQAPQHKTLVDGTLKALSTMHTDSTGQPTL